MSSSWSVFFFWQLNFLVTENRQREILDPLCEGVQSESLDALISVACQCVSSNPEDRLTMQRVVQVLESEVMTPCPSDFYDSNSDWKRLIWFELDLISLFLPLKGVKQTLEGASDLIRFTSLYNSFILSEDLWHFEDGLHHLCPFDH